MNCCPVTLVLLLLVIGNVIAAEKKPHIIYILCDDVGWNDVSYHGNDQIPTPNIDALAYSGVILHKHYVQPICTPSRAALMTGKYPSNIGIQGVPIGGAQPKALPLDIKILPQYLKELGYRTSLVGKWHLGFYKKEYTPLERGFDSFFGYYNGLIDYYNHIYDDPIPTFTETCRGTKRGINWNFNGEHLYGLDLHRNETPVWDMAGKYATDMFTDEAVNQIENHDTNTPLFLYLAHLACHAGNWGQNLQAPNELVNSKFNYIIDPNRRVYAAMMSKLDESVGRVVAALKKKDMLQNSIIVFLSDNGAPTILSSQWQTPGSNYPLRGVKVTQWEGAVRTPAILWSPLLKHNSHISHQLMHITDWFPTLLSAAGLDSKQLSAMKVDGVDQWKSLIYNTASVRNKMPVELDELRNIYAVRRGNWKLVQGNSLLGFYDGYSGDNGENTTSPVYNVKGIMESDAGRAINPLRAMPNEKALLSVRQQVTIKCPPQNNPTPCDTFTNDRPCIFNIAEDPCERNDLSLQRPDILNRMKELLEEYRESLVPDSYPPYIPAQANPRKFNNTWEPWMA
ncbi:hypothetical protein L9F63_008030 [Diploptera punctata]|uniref:Sulfatase N-terminal domain-containing protein n=1 Tax=Diploptera punctata TaxID=6984 RepID=A0AAD7Z5Y9_DIPPU|nr:hypothetical protein L9F63_008030 [Diploptera punctata]